MIGQGSPSASPRPLSARCASAARVASPVSPIGWHALRNEGRGRRATPTGQFALWLCVTLVLSAGSLASAQNATMRLRMEWGGGPERLWQGKIAVSEGTLSQPHALGIEADVALPAGLLGTGQVLLAQQTAANLHAEPGSTATTARSAPMANSLCLSCRASGKLSAIF